MDRCLTCQKMLYRTDDCKGVGAECGRTDGGSKKLPRSSDRIRSTALAGEGVGSNPAVATRSTAARKDVHRTSSADGSADRPVIRDDGQEPNKAVTHPQDTASEAGTQAPPVDTKFNKTAYMRDYMRKRRAKTKHADDPAPR